MDISTKTYTFLHAPLPCFESVLNVHCREEHGVGRRTRMSRHETHSRILKLNAGILVFVPEKMVYMYTLRFISFCSLYAKAKISNRFFLMCSLMEDKARYPSEQSQLMSLYDQKQKNNFFVVHDILIREAAKKVLLLMAGPLRPNSPLPHRT